MLTAWCLSVAFVSPWVVGVPFVWLLRGCARLRGPDWLLVPFVGLAVVVCPLQVLVTFADLPLARTVPWFWAALVLPWGAFLACPSGRASLRAIPIRVLALTAVAYLCFGAGLLRQGVEEYRGKVQSDQYHYVVIAQAAMDVPFASGWDADGRPWLALAGWMKDDRLGHAVVHGFFAVTAGRDALDLFFPTLFLTGALLVPALRLLAPRVGLTGRAADLAALAGALVPGAGVMLSECFLSQAVFVPFLFAYVAVVTRAIRRPSLLPLAAVLVTPAFAAYPEFTPLLVGAGCAAALAAVVARPAAWRGALLAAVVPVAGVLLNPAAVVAARTVVARAGVTPPVQDPDQTLRAVLQSVWMDSLAAKGRTLPSGAFALVCFGLAAAGWVRCARCAPARRAAVLGGVGALMLLPVGVLALAPGLRYPIFKLFLTAAPLYALGVCLAARAAARGWQRRSAAGRLRLVAVAGVVLWFVADTVRYQENPRRRHDAEMAAVWNGPELRRVAEVLHAEPPTEVVLDLDAGAHPWVSSGALLYRARQHRFRIAAPRQVWLSPLDMFPAQLELGAAGPPRPGALVVARPGSGARVGGEVLVRTERYLVVRTDGPRREGAVARGR